LTLALLLEGEIRELGRIAVLREGRHLDLTDFQDWKSIIRSCGKLTMRTMRNAWCLIRPWSLFIFDPQIFSHTSPSTLNLFHQRFSLPFLRCVMFKFAMSSEILNLDSYLNQAIEDFTRRSTDEEQNCGRGPSLSFCENLNSLVKLLEPTHERLRV
jgi:hypothetical protein